MKVGSILAGAIAVGLLAGGASVVIPSAGSEPRTAMEPARSFTFCHTGGGTNCVVDGDTLWMDGVKIRVSDIDAPETHSPRCAEEARLGAKATQRLLALVNEGAFAVSASDNRDEDRYGRKLRVLTRDGQSLGGILVSEGLARQWTGSRRPWC